MENKNVNIPKISSSAEETLRVIANITLVLGFIATIVILFSISDYPVELGPVIFGIACAVQVSSILSWAVLRVIANISLRLKGIQETMLRRSMTDSEYSAESAKERKQKQSALEREEYEKYMNKQSLYIQEEFVEESPVLNSNFNVGDVIVYKGKQYDIKNINQETGELCIKKGISSFVWIKPEELSGTFS